MGALVVAAVIVGGAGCSGSTPGSGSNPPPVDGGAGGHGPDAGVACLAPGTQRKNIGTVCGCDSDCDSGFCVDGVCCVSACQDKCKACNVPGMMGSCSFVPSGVKPRSAATCVKGDVGECKQDGTCDGSGECRLYPTGTVCIAGMCDGAAVSGINVCDGNGRCVSGSLKICVPYACNQARRDCAAACTSNADCSTGHACVNGSCGPKPKGAVCTNDAECELGHCFDGVCCESSCKGGCVSCNQVGHVGTCWPVAAGVPDPRGICKDMLAPSCGQTGSCDGFGACDKYAEGTICVPPICSGDRLMTAQTCDGNGTCQPAGLNDCAPYRCGDGACKVPCKVDADCQEGHACVGGSCGLRQPGQLCMKATECASNFCVDGVCCTNACTGACRSCALAGTKGTCTNLAPGATDARNICKDLGASSCKTDGRCDVGGTCRKYRPGTQCAGETCNSNVYTGPSVCDANNQCAAPNSRTCAPFGCNGSKCFDACTKDSNCVAPNVCSGNSCGKKANGASCNNGMTECLSGICAQGICCATACSGACKSCALPASQGTCTNIPAGQPDSTMSCTDQGAATCGNNGKCDGNGTCQKYGAGTSCKDPTCPPTTTMLTPRSTCDGSGACVTPAVVSCVPYRCGSAVCKSTCTADADCAPGQVCTKGSCGLKPIGGTCSQTSECSNGLTCVQGICCNSACNNACQSCTLPGSVGTCKSLAAGIPDSRCGDQGAASCGNNGRCDGNGGCQKYVSGTQCVAPSCPPMTSTLNLAKTCDGRGNCKGGGTVTCGNYQCNGTNDCLRTCRNNMDCTGALMCDPKNSQCGTQKPAGVPCNNTSECQMGLFCTDGTCCTANSCSSCMACNVAGKAGHCDNVAPGTTDPRGMCAAQSPLVCGLTGSCDGGGACSFVTAGTTCGSNTCSGNVFTPKGSCNGGGTCGGGAPVNCNDYICTDSGCKVNCQADSDCFGGKTCSALGSPNGTCGTKKRNGGACNSGDDCVNGNCVDGTCCASSSCTTCNTCSSGSCQPVQANTSDPQCTDQGSASCGTKAVCDGSGHCATYAGTPCAAGSCGGAMNNMATHAAICGSSPGCPNQVTDDCKEYLCDPGSFTCKTSCSGDGSGDCTMGNVCTDGKCVAPPPPP